MTPVAEVDRMRGDEMIQIVVDLTSIVVIVRGGMIGDDEHLQRLDMAQHVSCKHVPPAPLQDWKRGSVQVTGLAW